MNFNDTKVSVSSADVPSTTESAQKTLPQRANRKNHHTKKRDAEKFRLQKKFSTVRLSSRRTLDETLETMFDMPRQMIVKPCVSFTSTKYIIDICSAYLDMLRSACSY